MKATNHFETANLATITVTFNPNIEQLERQLQAAPSACFKIIVDNASSPSSKQALASILEQFKNLHIVYNQENLGLARAFNQGAQAAAALSPDIDFLLLLDQDSIPQPGSVERLLKAHHHLQTQGRNVGCVGPLLLDPETNLTHGFHQNTRLRWTRKYPTIGSSTPVRCTNLNGSGTLVALALFQHLGGLDEPLFIDHVDTEWSFRVIAHGYELWGIPNALFLHSMGQESTRFWLFGWRIWPVRSPQRHYYLYRNAAILMSRPYVPKVWKTWAIAKLLLTTGIMTITGPARSSQVKSMWQGLTEGLKKNAL